MHENTKNHNPTFPKLCPIPGSSILPQKFKMYVFGRNWLGSAHLHAQNNVFVLLDHVVSGRIHMTTDIWSSEHGQERCIFYCIAH